MLWLLLLLLFVSADIQNTIKNGSFAVQDVLHTVAYQGETLGAPLMCSPQAYTHTNTHTHSARAHTHTHTQVYAHKDIAKELCAYGLDAAKVLLR